MAKFKAGDRIVFGRSKRNQGKSDITVGKIYKVYNFDGDLVFIDDAGDYSYVLGEPENIYGNKSLKATKIID